MQGYDIKTSSLPTFSEDSIKTCSEVPFCLIFESSDTLFLEFFLLRGFLLSKRSQVPFGMNVVHSLVLESKYSTVFKNVFPIIKLTSCRNKQVWYIYLYYTENILKFLTWETTNSIKSITYNGNFYISSWRSHSRP